MFAIGKLLIPKCSFLLWLIPKVIVISTPDDNKTYNTNDNDVSIDIEQLDMSISLEEIQNTISSF